MKKPIYLDYNATTPIGPEVAEAMLPYLYDHFGNPSSSHPYGIETKNAVERAGQTLRDLRGRPATATSSCSKTRFPAPGTDSCFCAPSTCPWTRTCVGE